MAYIEPPAHLTYGSFRLVVAKTEGISKASNLALIIFGLVLLGIGTSLFFLARRPSVERLIGPRSLFGKRQPKLASWYPRYMKWQPIALGTAGLVVFLVGIGRALV